MEWINDRLIPSVTLMLYFSPDAWDGPLSLFDMMDVKDPKIFSFLDNYHVRLIAPAQMADEEIMRFPVCGRLCCSSSILRTGKT